MCLVTGQYNYVYGAISIKVVPEQGALVEYERWELPIN